MEKRGIRDQMVIATKVRTFRAGPGAPHESMRVRLTLLWEREQYTTNFKRGDPNIKQKSSYNGCNLKSMHISVEASLKKLRTSYIDILYVHWWDFATPIAEVMNGLHNLVAQGKVLYLVRTLLRIIFPLAVS